MSSTSPPPVPDDVLEAEQVLRRRRGNGAIPISTPATTTTAAENEDAGAAVFSGLERLLDDDNGGRQRKRRRRSSPGSKKDRFQRFARCMLTSAGLCLTIAIGVAVFFMCALHFDAIGVPVLVRVVRSQMPRPQHYHHAAPRVRPDAASRTWATLMNATHARMNELFVSGRVDGAEAGCFRPSTEKYGEHQWLWDSAFHMRILSHFEMRRPVLDMYSILSMQDTTTGFVPEMIYWRPDPNQENLAARAALGYSNQQYTDITQMPILAFAAQGIAQRLQAAETRVSDDVKADVTYNRMIFLCNVVPRLHRYFMWWLERRDPDGDGLVSIVHPWESGIDASPLYDEVHRYNRARRYGTDVDDPQQSGWSGAPSDAAKHSKKGQAAGGDANNEDFGVPQPDELYPEFIVLLYRYRNRAGWAPSRLLDPVAAQQRCEGQAGSDADANHQQQQRRRDVRRATFDAHALWRSLWRRLDERTNTFSRDRTVFRKGSIVDGIFDVEDVGVNAVLAANMDTLVALYDELIDLIETSPTQLVHKFQARAAGKGDLCCWSVDADVRLTVDERVHTLRARRDEMVRAADTIADAIGGQMWDPSRRHFDSFHHVYHATGAEVEPAGSDDDDGDRAAAAAQQRAMPATCMEQRTLREDTIQSLMPLLLGGRISEAAVVSILEKLEDPKRFGVKLPWATVPTVSRSSRLYERHDSTLMWRGPSWPTTNWLVARGLATVATTGPSSKAFSASTRERAAALHRQLLSVWYGMHRHFGFSEYHDPEDGHGMGQEGLGMSHLLIDAVLNLVSSTSSGEKADDATTAAQQQLLLPDELRKVLAEAPNRAALAAAAAAVDAEITTDDRGSGPKSLRALLERGVVAGTVGQIDRLRSSLYPRRLRLLGGPSLGEPEPEAAAAAKHRYHGGDSDVIDEDRDAVEEGVRPLLVGGCCF